jgi:hypothetical protein
MKKTKGQLFIDSITKQDTSDLLKMHKLCLLIWEDIIRKKHWSKYHSSVLKYARDRFADINVLFFAACPLCMVHGNGCCGVCCLKVDKSPCLHYYRYMNGEDQMENAKAICSIVRKEIKKLS